MNAELRILISNVSTRILMLVFLVTSVARVICGAEKDEASAEIIKRMEAQVVTRFKQSNYAGAEAELRAMLKIRQRLHGPEHPDTLLNWHNVAAMLRAQGKFVEAVKEHRAVLQVRERIHGPYHTNTLESCFHLALNLEAAQEFDEARVHAWQATIGAREFLGPEHPTTRLYERLYYGLPKDGQPKRRSLSDTNAFPTRP